MAANDGTRNVALSDRDRTLMYGSIDESLKMLKRRINGEVNEGIKAILRQQEAELQALKAKVV